MRRRRPADPLGTVPERLREFRLDDWVVEGEAWDWGPYPPGDTSILYGALRAWGAARIRYHREHGWPAGDYLDMVKDTLAVRKAHQRAAHAAREQL